MGGARDWSDSGERASRGFTLGKQDGRGEGGPALFRGSAEAVYDVESAWPWQMRWICSGPSLNIFGRSLEDKASVRRWETVAVEDEGVEKLSHGKGDEEPAAEPPWTVLEVASILEVVVVEFEGAREEVDCDDEAGLVSWGKAEEESRETGADSWGELGGQGAPYSWISPSE